MVEGNVYLAGTVVPEQLNMGRALIRKEQEFLKYKASWVTQELRYKTNKSPFLDTE